MTKVLADMPNKETMSSIYEAIADMSDHHLKVASSYEELEKILDERNMKMMIETGVTSEEWDIGDVIVSEKKQGIALIVKDNDGMYCAMDIDGLDKSVTTYSTEDNAVYYCGGTGYFDKLKTMQSYFTSEGWHKVKAVLKVHSNIELGGDKRKSSNE